MGAMIGTCYRIQRNSFSEDLLIEELREKTGEWIECLQYKPRFVRVDSSEISCKQTWGERVGHCAHRTAAQAELPLWVQNHPPTVHIEQQIRLIC